ncbi:TPA: hypothetical protein U2I56_003656 [Providencia stuartii]|nr:hypothetical protein [Providencia stuartii]
MDKDELIEFQTIIDKFHASLVDFTNKEGMTLNFEKFKDENTNAHWYYYSIKIRPDLYDFNLKFDTSQGVISYCNDFKDNFLGAQTATFGGGKRLVIHPDNLNNTYIDIDENIWFFISKDDEIKRFLGYLLGCKHHARNFA